MGTWVSACPAKATSPIRSEDRARTNSVAVRRATSSRLAGDPQPLHGSERRSDIAHWRTRELRKPLAPPPPPQRQRREQQQQQGSREAHADDPFAPNSRARARARAASGATSTPCAVANAT